MGDRARQDWVHEHAETGKPVTPGNRLLPGGPVPPATHELHRARGRQGQFSSPFNCAVRLCSRRRVNGLAPFHPLVDQGMVPSQRRTPVAGGPGAIGHQISASGFANWTARSAGTDSGTPGFATASRVTPPLAWGPRRANLSPVIPTAHPLPFRTHASPLDLAAGPGCRPAPGGKVRWQKRFAFPPRRMKHGWQF